MAILSNITEEILEPSEVAGILRVSVEGVLLLIKRCDLPAFKVGSRYKVHREELVKFIERSAVQPKGEV